jgi:hypothetical protein
LASLLKKLLILSPHFPPINAPDMQRVRMALPYLRSHGWEPTVLAIAPESIEGGVVEQKLTETYPANIRVVRARGLSPRLTRWAGFGNLWLRCGRAFTRAGEQLLREEHFDLALFSTTQFSAFQLGPRWRRKFGLPYVLDYQDPWINEYYQITGTDPPGGRIKFALSQFHAGTIEPAALRESSGVVAVSDSYGAMLAKLYPWFPAGKVKLLPFGAAAMDFERLGNHVPESPIIDFSDGLCHQVYVGRCGPDMHLALKILFRAFSLFRKARPDQAARMRFHFIGTDYAPPPLGREWALPVAEEEGVLDFVSEHRYRVPYFDSLYYLRHADALIAVGSDDPTYSASKFFSYILANRPLLMIFHRRSPILGFAQALSVPHAFGFEDPADIARISGEISRQWFGDGKLPENQPFSAAAFAPFTAEQMVRRLVQVLGDALADQG